MQIQEQELQQQASKVSALVDVAKEQEETNPEQARQLYLKASKQLLELSRKYPEKQQDLYYMSYRLYLKSLPLKKINNIENSEKAEEFVTDAPRTAFTDICGLENLKEEVRLKIIEPLKHPEIFKKFGKKVGGGIIMYGPPGCGKTLMAQAAANEARINFFNVKVSSLRSKYVGQSERNIARLFKTARKKMPAILFFDEFEALGADRSSSTQYTKSEVSQLLTEMDGFGTKDQQLLIIAATNEPWEIDIALKRHGRFGSSIFVPPPDFDSRVQLFKQLLNKKPVEDIDYERLAKLTDFFSGADIAAVCENAADSVLREYFRTKKLRAIKQADLENAIKNVKPASKKWFKIAIKKFRENGDIEMAEDIGEYLEKELPDKPEIIEF